jgi:hypothetical protein
MAAGGSELCGRRAGAATSYLFWSENGSVTFQYQVKNFGSAASPPARVVLAIYHGAKAITLGGHPIPVLKPGVSHIERVTLTVPKSQLLVPGAYGVVVCVHALGIRATQAQCYPLKRQLAVIADRWGGMLTSHATHASGVVEDTRSVGTQFLFDSFHEGVATYKLRATIQIADSGTAPSGGCTWSGSFVVGSPSGVLSLDYYPKETYYGLGALPSAGTYPILGSCGPGMQLGGPISSWFFLTDDCTAGRVCAGSPLPFGATKLTGSFTFTEPGMNATSNWSLNM